MRRRSDRFGCAKLRKCFGGKSTKQTHCNFNLEFTSELDLLAGAVHSGHMHFFDYFALFRVPTLCPVHLTMITYTMVSPNRSVSVIFFWDLKLKSFNLVIPWKIRGENIYYK